MDKLYAIERPDGTIIRNRECGVPMRGSRRRAWKAAANDDGKLYGVWVTGRGIFAWIKEAESLGYRCVEVEVVKKEAWK